MIFLDNGELGGDDDVGRRLYWCLLLNSASTYRVSNCDHHAIARVLLAYQNQIT